MKLPFTLCPSLIDVLSLAWKYSLEYRNTSLQIRFLESVIEGNVEGNVAVRACGFNEPHSF